MQRDPQIQTPGLPELYPTATLAVVKRVIQRQENVVQLLIQGIERVELVRATETTPYLQVEVAPLSEPQDHSPEGTALFRNIQALVRKAVRQEVKAGVDLIKLLSSHRTDHPEFSQAEIDANFPFQA